MARGCIRLRSPAVLLTIALSALIVGIVASFAVGLLRRRTRVSARGEDLGSVSSHWLTSVHRDTNP
jgi:hypothetical protein